LKGAYVAKPEVGELKKIVMGAGSEVQHLMAAFKDDAGVTVVSMLFMGRFDRQDSTYRKEVLPKSCTDRTAMEAVVSGLWHKYTVLDGKEIRRHREQRLQKRLGWWRRNGWRKWQRIWRTRTTRVTIDRGDFEEDLHSATIMIRMIY
jgi:hypothetical protein|tara:strand:- start:161 stop:601 length:441 start_codon:yes stop_codon:yes gene_type:complete